MVANAGLAIAMVLQGGYPFGRIASQSRVASTPTFLAELNGLPAKTGPDVLRGFWPQPRCLFEYFGCG
jgi:hypothetical protein